MNIIKRLFKGGAVEATAERTEVDISMRLAEIESAVMDGSATDEQLQELPFLKNKLATAQYARQRLVDLEYRAPIEKARARYITDVQAEITELWAVMPHLRWILAGLSALEEKPVSGYDGKNFDALTGLRLGSARRIGQMIAEELRGTALGAECYVEGQVSAPKITQPSDPILALPEAHARDIYGTPLHRDRTYS